MMVCPRCAEDLHDDAIVCAACGNDLPASMTRPVLTIMLYERRHVGDRLMLVVAVAGLVASSVAIGGCWAIR